MNVVVSDLDGDGDLDVLSIAQFRTSRLAWHENVDGLGTLVSQRVTTLARGAVAIFASDLDGDGDHDIISTFDGKLAWYENGSDCNDNDTNDACDLVDGTSFDCNRNGVPDVCDLSELTSPDCNGNGQPDECDVDDGTSRDCNVNEIPDECDLANQTSTDCNTNGRLDECELTDSTDCNVNARLDTCDLAEGSSLDCNENDRPDECDLSIGFGDESVAITTDANAARSVFAVDIDGDGDIDVLSASRGDAAIAWYENTDGLGKFGPQRVIDSDMTHASSVFAADLDGDGDIDVLSSSLFDSNIAWYENVDRRGTFAPRRTITESASGANFVFAADLDGDGDTDVLSASGEGATVKIAWYENTDGSGSFGPQRVITTDVDWTLAVFAADLDGDGDFDVLSASANSSKIAWYENTDSLGTFGRQRVISTFGGGSVSVYAADLDGNGDMDVLSASWSGDKIVWHENSDGLGTFGPQRVISASADVAMSVFAADLDGDGDIDVLSASLFDDKIAWYQNTNGLGTFGPAQVITADADGPRSVFAADLDGDGDIDVLSASSFDDKIAWYENRIDRQDCNENDTPDECDVGQFGDGESDDCNGNIVPDECEFDGDGDDVPDDCDLCLDSLTDDVLIVASCVTVIENTVFDDGCTMADLIAECEDASRRRGNAQRCVDDLARQWLRGRIITGREHGLIVSCAAAGKNHAKRTGR